MIAESFEIDGEGIDIHIIDNKEENKFSFVAKKKNNDFFNGFEFKVNKVTGIDVDSFSQSAPAFAIVSFMRLQIEERHWQVYATAEVAAQKSYSEKSSSPREAGRTAFLNKQHYCHNPYTGLDAFVHDEWDQGWAEAAQKNPDAFDFITDTFKE